MVPKPKGLQDKCQEKPGQDEWGGTRPPLVAAPRRSCMAGMTGHLAHGATKLDRIGAMNITNACRPQPRTRGYAAHPIQSAASGLRVLS